jgi:hypothetical protein
MKDDIEGAIELLKKSALLRLPLAEKWLELLSSDEITKSEVEHLAEQAFNIESIDKRWCGSHLFHSIKRWAEEATIRITKMKSWKEKLLVIDYIAYYEQWIVMDGNGDIKQEGLTISKRWLELINSSSVTQNDIDSFITELLAPQEMVGTMRSSITFDFLDWAEGYGFNVPSYELVREHYDSIFQNVLKKIREENRRNTEK